MKDSSDEDPSPGLRSLIGALYQSTGPVEPGEVALDATSFYDHLFTAVDKRQRQAPHR